MTKWITDDKGNRASIEYWGSKKAAEASLKTLTNCTNCTNCTDCTNCTNCTNCRYCRYCTNCRYCDLTKRHVFVPVSEPRAYTWLAIVENGDWVIRAGCRKFTLQEARAHWLDVKYDGPDTIKTTVKAALDWVEAHDQ